jgi:hypothetical protein
LKLFTFAVCAGSLLPAGCQQPSVPSSSVRSPAIDSDNVMFCANRLCFSAETVVRNAREYLARERVDTDLTGYTVQVYAPSWRPDCIADVFYSRGMGEPVLRVYIGQGGQAIAHTKSVGVCGTGTQEQ